VCQLFITTDMIVSSVSTALSINIPSGLLVDCCCESVPHFFSCSNFWWLQFLKLSGYTEVQQNFHREREGTGAATTMAVHKFVVQSKGWVFLILRVSFSMTSK